MQHRPTSRLSIDSRRDTGRDERSERLFRQAVAHEMLLARESTRSLALDHQDPRWMLALETRRALQGATLAYEDRRRLLGLANRVGIRPFDANLILAVVQDRARRGEALETAAETIAIVPRPAPRRFDATPIWIAATVVAIVVDLALIAWLMFH